MSDDSALGHCAKCWPDLPWIFFRGARGHFEWISFGDAEAYLQGTLRRPRTLPGDVEAWIRRAATLAPDRAPRAGSTMRGKAREVWVAWRAASDPTQVALTGWALARGAAVLVETQPTFPAALVEWARPTIVDAPREAFDDWFAQLETGAPNWLRSRWLRRRIGRLRWLVIADRDTAPAERSGNDSRAGAIERRLRALLPDSEARVLRFESVDGSPLV